MNVLTVCWYLSKNWAQTGLFPVAQVRTEPVLLLEITSHDVLSYWEAITKIDALIHYCML